MMGESTEEAGAVASEPVEPEVDSRVVAILEVLGGAGAADVAQRWQVDPALLRRWVRDFVAAGTEQVTNRPGERAARQRDRFLAAIAHETRTPLSIAQGWLELAAAESVTREELVDTLHMVQVAIDRLSERLVDIELLAACSMGRVTVHPRTVRIADLIGTMPGLTQVRSSSGCEEIRADPDLFRRVLRDLWWAAGLSPAPRSRVLETEIVEPWVELRVIRRGEPLDVRVLQALFDPFGLNDDATGVTIGLYLARALAVAHGGTIGVDQDEQGAVLWVRLPRSGAVADQV